MLGDADLVAFVASCDLERAAQFYGQVLGFRMLEASECKRYEGMMQDEDGVWIAPGGSRVAWFADPDGNVLSLQQPPAV